MPVCRIPTSLRYEIPEQWPSRYSAVRKVESASGLEIVVQLHHPTPDVEAAYRWMLRRGFVIVDERGGPGESFGNQLVRLADDVLEVTVSRDRAQWMLSLCPRSWSAPTDLGLVLAVMDGSYRDSPRRGKLADQPGKFADQLPPGTSWVEALPSVFEWVNGGQHREAITKAGGRYRADLLFGVVPGRPGLDDIGSWVALLADAIAAPDSLRPPLGADDADRSYVEKTGPGFAYVARNEGVEVARTESVDGLEILACVFADITEVMAVDWEAEHRHEADVDGVRRRVFAKQLVLLEELHPGWARRRVAELGVLLDEVGLNPLEARRLVADVAD